jgi:hypothetical protein
VERSLSLQCENELEGKARVKDWLDNCSSPGHRLKVDCAEWEAVEGEGGKFEIHSENRSW